MPMQSILIKYFANHAAKVQVPSLDEPMFTQG